MGKETLHLSEADCPSHEIAAYIDGELDPAMELAFETHILGCTLCRAELNYQKEFLCHLDLSLKQHDDIELPANFAETVVVKAESSVSGLRGTRERSNAIFITAALILFAVFALSFDPGNMLQTAADVFEKSLAVIGFVFHVVSSFAVGFEVVLRTLVGRFLLPGTASFIFFGIFVVAFLVFTRMLLRFRRT